MVFDNIEWWIPGGHREAWLGEPERPLSRIRRALVGRGCASVPRQLFDAATRLLDVARDRSPRADLRVGDMHALPWDDATFDVVTSFRGIWGDHPSCRR